jgi:mannitol/fructose-specific phosphotransferase system IIA component (Ntr-type)
MPSLSTDDGFHVRCEICGNQSIVHVARPPGDSVCSACGSFLWVTAVVEMTRQNSFVPDLQLTQLDATHRDDAFREISESIAVELSWTDRQTERFVEALLEREQLGSTAIGRGFAVPHAKAEWIENCFSAMAMTPAGMDFNASDGELVHTIILVAAPQSRPGDNLRLLERISRSLRWSGTAT